MRIDDFLEIAEKISSRSDCRHKHGALLVSGGRIINSGHNRNKYCSFGQRFRGHGRGLATVHAEISAVLGVDRSKTAGSDLFVAREGRKLSKPCDMCIDVLRFVGISRVYYSMEDGFGVINIKELE